MNQPATEPAAQAEPGFAELFEQSLDNAVMKTGEVIMAEVVEKTGDYITVNAGLKSEAEIPIAEFKNDEGEVETQVGDRVEVAIVALEDGSGQTRLSRERAHRARTWAKLEKAHDEQRPVSGVIIGKVKGGFTVSIDNMRAFLPGSLLDVRPVKDAEGLEGTRMDFKLIKLDRARNNLVVSRRAVMENEMSAERSAMLSKLEEGQAVRGTVKNLTDYGAFVSLGGIDGLLHITDMAWKRVKHPSEVISVGQEIEVRVLKFDRERNRVSLGLKQMGEDPWNDLKGRYPEGARIQGTITNITDYGAFVELEDGVEGLVHVSEMDWGRRSINPQRMVQLGDRVDVMVLDVDNERRRISLGMKQCKPNPWEEFAAAHKKGDKVTGTIKSITDFGVFVGLEGNIDGLIHISDLSWDSDGGDVIRQFKKGDPVEVVVGTVDPAAERISLGYKQATEDPYVIYAQAHPKNSVVKGKVKSLSTGGKGGGKAVIALDERVEGSLRFSDLSEPWEPRDGTEPPLAVGQEVEAKITTMDRKNRRIFLSVKAMEEDMRQEGMEEYSRKVESAPATLGDRFRKLIGRG